MDLVEFERLEQTFQSFHAHFASAFGRKQWRERARDYWRGLLVQAAERGNAENLSEAVDTASARVLQRFLTEAKWAESAVIERLQAYLAPRLARPDAVWVLDDSGFPKQGQKSVGVARQYCGALGKIAGCQVGVFLAYVSPRGRALVDKRLYLPREWTDAPDRCAAAGVPEEERQYRSKTELALALLQQAKQWRHLVASWVTGDDRYGQQPDFRAAVAREGFRYVLEVPGHLTVFPQTPLWEQRPYAGKGRPPNKHPQPGQRETLHTRRAKLPPEAWQALTVGEGAQGPRTDRFARERVRESRDREPGVETWLLYKENLAGSEPRTFFSNADCDTALEELARVAMSRWPIETEFEEEKSLVARDEYEVRSWAGWQHHVTMSMLASTFLLTLQQDWGEKAAAAHTPPGLPDRLRTLAQAALDRNRPAPVADGDPRAQ